VHIPHMTWPAIAESLRNTALKLSGKVTVCASNCILCSQVFVWFSV
jgi:hypothetical protein